MITTFSSIAWDCKIMEFSKALSKYLSRKAGCLRWWGGSETKDRLCAGKPFRKRGARIYPAKMLTMEEQFFAVLALLRTATSVKEMVRRCGISTASFSKLFTTWVNFLVYELLALHEVPSRKPRVLIKSFLKFSPTRIVIDCTEVFSHRPSGLHARKQ